MPRAITVQQLEQRTIEQLSVEIVERKGRGHPDYIADSAAESVCKALCRYYRDEFGAILHHNVDKGLVVGGRAHAKFGGGEVYEPMYITVAGRAITNVFRENQLMTIPVGCLALGAIKDLLRENFRFLDADKHIIAESRIRQGSTDLIRTFELGEEMPLANDTSFGVSFAPLSTTERLVLETEKHLNSTQLKKQLPEVGEDIKVMGMRRDGRIFLTVAAAMISQLVPDVDHYLNVKQEIEDRISDLAAGITSSPVDVKVNTADNPEKGVVYLTVTGTTAEAGDDGNTGRGNRINGLITPCRPMSLEAAAGKNPVSHVGKTYNVLAMKIANRIHEEVEGIHEVYVKILSQIGKPIDQPAIADVELILEQSYGFSNVKAEVEAIADDEIANIRSITDLILSGEIHLF